MYIPTSSFNEIRWPAMPSAICSTRLALQYQLDESQWWSVEELKQHQFKQFQLVFEHARHSVPFYHQLYANLPETLNEATLEAFLSRLPIISFSQIRQAADRFASNDIPVNHGKVFEKSISSSSAESIKIKETELGALFFHAHTLRDHLWHKRDLCKKLAIINLPDNKQVQGVYPSWGPSVDGVYKTGQLIVLTHQSTAVEQWSWLKQHNPEYLMTTPCVLKELVKLTEGDENALSKLRMVTTMGDVVSDELRETVKRLWNVSLLENYICDGVAYLALQCPEHKNYHVQSESVIVEVLDSKNKTCQPGETGRVVITTLHNFASPLIRYETGEYVQVAESCACGRGLPVLGRISEPNSQNKKPG